MGTKLTIEVTPVHVCRVLNVRIGKNESLHCFS